jgi:hypothetical protein
MDKAEWADLCLSKIRAASILWPSFLPVAASGDGDFHREDVLGQVEYYISEHHRHLSAQKQNPFRHFHGFAIGLSCLGLLFFLVGGIISFIATNIQSRLDVTVFAAPGLTDEEKLQLVTEIRAGTIVSS